MRHAAAKSNRLRSDAKEEQILDRDLIRRNKKSVVHNRDMKATDNDEIVTSSTMIVGKRHELCNSLRANNKDVQFQIIH